MDYLDSELKALRGRVTGAERKKKRVEDAPEETIVAEEVQEDPRPRAPARALGDANGTPAGTAHLSKRFRGF